MIKLTEIPAPELIHKKSKSLAVLDAIFCQKWELRYFSHNSKWSENSEMASMRDGEGDDYFILFIKSGAAIKGSQLGSPQSGFNCNTNYPSSMDIYTEFFNEPAFSMDEATFIICFDIFEKRWKKIGAQNDDNILEGGADVLLKWICNGPEFYKIWAEKYFEKKINIDLVRSIFDFQPLDIDHINIIASDIDNKKLYEDLDEIGYPYERLI